MTMPMRDVIFIMKSCSLDGIPQGIEWVDWKEGSGSMHVST